MVVADLHLESVVIGDFQNNLTRPICAGLDGIRAKRSIGNKAAKRFPFVLVRFFLVLAENATRGIKVLLQAFGGARGHCGDVNFGRLERLRIEAARLPTEHLEAFEKIGCAGRLDRFDGVSWCEQS